MPVRRARRASCSTRCSEGIGLTRDDVFVANVLKCRPPGNRDPLPAEIRACEPHLFRQIALIRPALVCTLGNFATKLLSGRPDGIRRVHGHELPLADRRPSGAALPALPPGRGALHAVDARAPSRRTSRASRSCLAAEPAPGAARRVPDDLRGRRSRRPPARPRRRARRRAARPVLTRPCSWESAGPGETEAPWAPPWPRCSSRATSCCCAASSGRGRPRWCGPPHAPWAWRAR